jgi:type III secretory pathway lipoprotein EscJ
MMATQVPRRWAGAVLAGLLATAACTVPVATNLDEERATDALSALRRAGIAAETRPATVGPGTTVEVPRSDGERALAIVARAPSPSPTLAEALGEPALVPSRASETARIARGLAGELERTLAGFDGVAAARVHIALPEGSPLAPAANRERTARASVVLARRAGAGPIDEDAVRRIVAGAVAGIGAGDIALVVDGPPVTEPRPPDLARVGPITTTRGSLPALRAAVAVAVLVNLGLVALLVTIWIRSARRGADSPAREPQP